jgi:hypothetical protein
MFKLPTLSAAALVLAPALALAASATADTGSADARALYDANCVKCHGPEVYTRADRRIQSLDALHGQVRMCEQNLGLKWFDDEIKGVASLLNREYYKFDE